MPYATQADMVEQFGDREVIALTDRDNTGAIDATVLDPALVSASAEIDGYLASRYSLPLASAPKVLAVYCCDIARYRLVGAAATETDTARNRYKDAIRFLEAVRDGKIKLGADAGGAVPEPGANLVQMVTSDRVFSRNAR